MSNILTDKEYSDLLRLQASKEVQELDAIQECENLYPEMCAEFKKFQRAQYEMLCKKQLDYGPNNIALGTQLKTTDEKLASISGIIIRANDKLQRLINLVIINKRSPKNESIIDTFMDLAVYSTIALVVDSGKWGK